MQVDQGHSHLAEVSQVAGGPPAGRHGATEVVGLQADDGHVGEAPTGCPGLRQAPGQLVAADIQHLQSLHIKGGGQRGSGLEALGCRGGHHTRAAWQRGRAGGTTMVMLAMTTVGQAGHYAAGGISHCLSACRLFRPSCADIVRQPQHFN